jgi:hypothetical protein
MDNTYITIYGFIVKLKFVYRISDLLIKIPKLGAILWLVIQKI